MTKNQKILLNLLKPRALGMRIETIIKRSGLTEREVVDTAASLSNVVKYKTSDWTFGYKISTTKISPGVAEPRKAVPIHALPTYMGETKRAGAVI
jgi:hypothetical protein